MSLPAKSIGGAQRRSVNFASLVTAACLVLLTPCAFGASGSKKNSAPPKPMEIVSNTASKTGPLAEQQREGALAEQFCTAVRDQAAEARYAYQAAQLKALAKEIDLRLVRLEQRSAELKEWIVRREEFANKATEHLVGIIAVMRPEAASAQLVRLDAMIAAAILSKLGPRVASAILNEMAPDKAAMLTTILAASANNSDAGGKQ